MSRIYNQRNGALNEHDRLTLAQLLIKAGYTVRIDKEKKGTQKNSPNIHYVEFFEDNKSSIQ